MRWLLRLLGLLGVLILLAAIVAIYLVATFEPGAYRERIETEMTRMTGRDFSLAGEIGLTLFPVVGLRLEGVRVANAPGFGDEPFAEVEVAEAAVAVLPLLRGEIQVLRVAGDGVTLALARAADGRNNWDDLLARFAGEASGSGNPSGSHGDRGNPANIAVEGLELTRLRVEWDDRQSGTRALIDPANLRLQEFRSGTDAPMRLDASVRVEEQGTESVTLHLRADALLNLDLPANRHALRDLAAEYELRLPAFPAPLLGGVTGSVALDLPASEVRVEPLSLRVGGLDLTGTLMARGLHTEAPGFEANLRTNVFSPRLLLTELGLPVPDTTDPSVLHRMSIEFNAAGDLQRPVVETVTLVLDDSTLRGDASLDRSGGRPHLRFTLAGDHVDLDRYLPPEVEQVRAPDEAPPGVPPEEADVPIDLPATLMRALDLDGRVTLERLSLLGLVLEGIEVNLRARDGEWRVEPLTGSGYEGRVEGRATVDASRDVPRFALAVSLDGVAIEPLLEALRDQESRLVGTGSLALNVATEGDSVSSLTKGLNGRGEMSFADGAVRGINVARIIREADARLRGERVEPDDEPNQTDFTELRGSFRIDGGVVRNDDLSANSPLLRVAGRGAADLPARTLDYRIDTTLVATIEGQGGRSLDDLRGVNLPIRITGSFAEPRFRLDLDDVVRERLEDRVRREVDRVQERLLDRLGGGSERNDPAAAGAADPSESRSLEDQLQRLRRSLR